MANLTTFGGVHFGTGRSIMAVFGNEQAAHSSVKLDEESTEGYVPWGTNNDYPQKLHAALSLNGAAGSGLRLMRNTHYGQGFHLFIWETTEDGKRNKKMVDLNSYPEIKEYFRRNKMNRFWVEKIADQETFAISFPEFILDKSFNKIVSNRRLQTAKIRFEPINPKTGLIENVLYCHDWTNVSDAKGEFVTKIPVIDSYWPADQIKEYCKKKRIYKFVMPCFYPLLTETYYPEVDWHAVFKNGWLEVANNIPKYKKALFENQLNIKYMVYISEEYFRRQYENDWLEFTPTEKQKIREDLTRAIDDHLSGVAKAGKSIQSVVYKDHNGDWVKGIEVQPIMDLLKDGAYLPEATAANSEIMFAIGADPSLLGAGIPGGKMNTGSGSDKREAFSILTSLFKTKREITLESWNLIKNYNQWPEELEADFANTILTTLDKNPTGVENAI